MFTEHAKACIRSSCRAHHDRDTNSANNIHRRGRATLAAEISFRQTGKDVNISSYRFSRTSSANSLGSSIAHGVAILRPAPSSKLALLLSPITQRLVTQS